MLIIVCGEDSAASRSYFLGLQEKYKKRGFETQTILANEIESIVSESSSSPNLFGLKRIFITEALNKTFRRGSDKTDVLKSIDQNKDIEVLDWENGISKRELKIKIGKIKEFKPDKNIFQLLDACYPGNLKDFFGILDVIVDSQNEIFILTMLQRHLRTLLLIKSGDIPTKLQSWQVGKLRGQASKWNDKKLTFFYDGLYKIDSSLKLGRNPHGIKKSLDILACYLLK